MNNITGQKQAPAANPPRVNEHTGRLVLSRFPGERIILQLPNGDTIELEYLELRDHQKIRLGFIAPENVRVMREELLGGER